MFQFCKCLKLLGNLMILIVLALVALSYYPVVVAVYGPLMVNPDIPVATEVAAVFVVVSFHILVSAKRATQREGRPSNASPDPSDSVGR